MRHVLCLGSTNTVKTYLNEYRACNYASIASNNTSGGSQLYWFGVGMMRTSHQCP